MGEWNRFLRRKVQLIACGGTAMILIGVKPSTKDVDFMVPMAREYAYLTKQLKDLGYRQIQVQDGNEMERIFVSIFSKIIGFTRQNCLLTLLRRAGILY